jgi:hypothetical protein
MIQRYTVIALLVITAFVSSCNLNKQEDARRLSNELGFANDSLFYYGKVWNDELRIAVKMSDFSTLAPIRQDLVKYIDNKITHFSGFEDVGGSEQMRQAELEFLKFEKQIIQNHFATFERFDSNTSTDELAKAYEQLLKASEAEKAKLDAFHKLQQEYAEKNDIPKPLDSE